MMNPSTYAFLCASLIGIFQRAGWLTAVAAAPPVRFSAQPSAYLASRALMSLTYWL